MARGKRKRSKVNFGGGIVADCYNIGDIAEAVSRCVESVRRYEKLGAIDAPKWRAKKTQWRVYTKGEFDLAVGAILAWLEEHGKSFPSPNLNRLREVYNDMKEKGLKKDAEHYYIFKLPIPYALPERGLQGGAGNGAEGENGGCAESEEGS